MSETETTEQQAETQAVDSARVLFGVGGLVAIVLGLFVLFVPGVSSKVALTVIAAVIGSYALITGIVYVGIAVFSKSQGGWARISHILLGVLYVVGGVIIMSNLVAAGVVTAMLFSIMIGILWLFEGVLAFVTAAKAENRVWAIIYGAVSVIAGAVLLISPLLGAVTLWWLLGASMVVLGVVQVVRAFKIGRS